MTLSANRVEGTQNIKVRTTYGPVTNEVDENFQHVRGFHTQLGQILDQMDAEYAPKPPDSV
jgi:hypothetical protein